MANAGEDIPAYGPAHSRATSRYSAAKFVSTPAWIGISSIVYGVNKPTTNGGPECDACGVIACVAGGVRAELIVRAVRGARLGAVGVGLTQLIARAADCALDRPVLRAAGCALARRTFAALSARSCWCGC